ncbi:unnamed protein product [Nesidiocoris tenuis]|uniref:Syndetin C-terminal domain-containing protein n=1 Tax=Nesidiocoris tenuis TaxID=355587 RepID=A0A6H5HRT6_9HEMI|nr:unnamed protein product [Nesidiocoris tenuis]
MERKVDEFKAKVLDLIQKKPKIPVLGPLADYDHYNQKKVKPVEESQPQSESNERPSDQEILETLDAEYFSTNADFDPGRFEMNKLDDLMKIEQIEECLVRLKRQQVVVSNNVLQMILEKQSACQEELKRVVDVEECVEKALSDTKMSRANLQSATRHFTTASLGILGNYRKRTLVQQLLRYLKTIKTMHETESKMPELFKIGDFPGAIGLLLECQRVAGRYRQFTCIDALTVKLQDTLVMAEEHLDEALAAMCVEFDAGVYRKLQDAYALLGKTEVAIDQLHMHFISAVQKKSSYVVQSYAITEASPSNDKKPYAMLCKDVSEEHFIPCLLDLCKALWRIILSYHQVSDWHQKNARSNRYDADSEASHVRKYTETKLNHGLTKLWQDVQSKVTSLVLAASLSNYKIDDFLEVLSILHRFSQVGEELCDSNSEDVAESVRTQSINYFNKFHSDKLDDLKVFLENESWTPCPFRGLRSCVVQCAGIADRHDSSSISVDGSSTGTNFFARFPDPRGPTPFDASFHVESREEHILSEAVFDDLLDDCSEKSDDEHRGPLLTNTTISVLRLCGKYLQMSRLLRSISGEVVTALTQLFEYYLYTVHSFFATDEPKRIKDSLIQKDQDLDVTVGEALVSPMVDLSRRDTFYGLRERIVAVESLVFLAKEFDLLKVYLETLLDSSGPSIRQLQLFYDQTVSIVPDMRRPVFACVAWRCLDWRQTLSMMSKVDWQVQDVQEVHSRYVDFIFHDLSTFHSGLSQTKMSLHVPDPAVAALWECLALLIAHVFVEGFASAKKYSDAGRGLMRFDFGQYVYKMKKLCPLKPVPFCDIVEQYMGAFYLTEDGLESWVREHREYSTKQLLTLVNCQCQSNKKLRQKLTAFVEESDKKT